jgi:hypothetical protein
MKDETLPRNEVGLKWERTFLIRQPSLPRHLPGTASLSWRVEPGRVRER